MTSVLGSTDMKHSFHHRKFHRVELYSFLCCHLIPSVRAQKYLTYQKKKKKVVNNILSHRRLKEADLSKAKRRDLLSLWIEVGRGDRCGKDRNRRTSQASEKQNSQGQITVGC